MREAPSPELAQTLLRLRLAGPRQWVRVRRRVAKMAGPLPRFDSLWLDALRQAGWLTAYQSQTLAAGHSDELSVANWLVAQRLLPWNGASRLLVYPQIDAFVPPGKQPLSTLLVADVAGTNLAAMPSQLAQLCELAEQLPDWSDTLPQGFGLDSDRLWLQFAAPRGECLADVLREHGRLPPHVAWQVFRQLVQQMAGCEGQGLMHGDIHVRNVWIEHDGTARLYFCGIRPLLEQQQYQLAIGGRADQQDHLLPVDAESLAPELACTPANRNSATELFAFGSLGWHLLSGRPAVNGATAQAKRHHLSRWHISSVKQLAPDAPPLMIEIVDRCLHAQGGDRPRSFPFLADIVGTPDAAALRSISRYLRKPDRWLLPRPRVRPVDSAWKTLAGEVLAMAACVLVVLAGWRWFAAPKQPLANVAATSPAHLSPPASLQLATASASTGASPSLGEVELAQYQVAANQERYHRRGDERALLRLPTDKPTQLAQLALRPRHLVCADNAEQGGCAVVYVPPEGLVVDVPDVRFRNVVFRVGDAANDDTAAEQHNARPMVRLLAPSARFENCLFIADPQVPITAILWEHGSDDASQFDPVGDRLSLTRCAAEGVHAVVDRRRLGDVRLELTDTLLLDVGVAIYQPFPQRGQVAEVLFGRVTHRGGGAVLSLGDVPAAHLAGKLLVRADDSLFAPQASAALVQLNQPDHDQSPPLVWQGQGSVTLPNTAILQVGDRSRDDDTDEGDDQPDRADGGTLALEISGLARASFTFVSEEMHDPLASAVRKLVGPRKSLAPPGVPEGVLHDLSAWRGDAMPPHN
jgi:hypothetical protein